MQWIRHLPARLALLALLTMASMASAGELAVPDVHDGYEHGPVAHDHQSASHGALSHSPVTTPDGHPVHTCHCVHAHGLALIAAATSEFTVRAPLNTATVDLAGTPGRNTAAPPFHPPKTLS